MARHSRGVGWQRSQGAGVLLHRQKPNQTPVARPTARRRRGHRAAWSVQLTWCVGITSFICVAAPRLAVAQVSAWEADPGCPAPTNLPLTALGRRSDAPADDLSVRVTVSAVPGGWRAVLAASEHDGSPLGERVLEHPTCEELNRAVLVSLSVLLGTQSPLAAESPETAPAAEAGSIPAAPETPPADGTPPTTEVAHPEPASEPAPPQPEQSAQTPAPPLQGAEVTERRTPAERRAAATDSTPTDEPSDAAGVPRWTLPRPTFDVYGGVVLGFEATDARTLGGAASLLASNRDWGVRVNGGFRASTGNVADNPDVKFWVASGTASACKYFGSATWLLCAGPILERLHGTVPEASTTDAEAWLLGGSVGISTLRHTRDTWGWFAQLELQVRRGANFQVDPAPNELVDGSPRTLFSYPWVGVLLSLGPAVRL